jgi:hypothetical protein
MAATGNSAALEVAVVLVIYRRPHLVRELLRCLQAVRPAKIWIVADGPSASAPRAEQDLCLSAREEAEKGILWPCEVRPIYSGANMGLRRRVETGLNEVFRAEDEAIILEEDCQPRPDFFPFVQTMLKHYRHVDQVAAVSGNCFLPKWVSLETSYYFSRYFHVWGWASWARAWRDPSSPGSPWPERGYEAIFPDSKMDEAQYWNRIFQRMSSGQIQSWAYPWMARQWAQGRCFITPAQNLVVNHGFGLDGTNTRDSKVCAGVQRIRLLTEPYRSPEAVAPDSRLDRAVFENHILRQQGRLSFWPRLRRSLEKRFPNLI